jgi:hypothetical protein
VQSLLSCGLIYESSCPAVQTEAINLSLAWQTDQLKGCQLQHTTGQDRWICVFVKMKDCFYIVLNYKGIISAGLGSLKSYCPFMYDTELELSVA